MENQDFQKDQIPNGGILEIYGNKSLQQSIQAQQLAKQYGIKFFMNDIVDKQQNYQTLLLYQSQIKKKINPMIIYNDKIIGDVQDLQRYLVTFKDSLSFESRDVENEKILIDPREAKDKKNQFQQMCELTQANCQLFSIKQVEKQKIHKNYIFEKDNFSQMLYYKSLEKQVEKENWYGNKKQMKFNDDSFVTYYDNKLTENQSFQFSIPLLVLSGFPSFLFEWKSLQQKLGFNTCRIIHFIQPGLDGLDERRGLTRGYLQDNVLLLRNFLVGLGIKKIILTAHSYGTYLMNLFLQVFPDYIVSIMQIGSLGVYPNDVILKLTQRTHNRLRITQQNMQQHRQQLREQLDEESYRKKIENQIFNQNGDRVVEYDIAEILVISKFHTQFRRGLNDVFEIMRNTHKKLRLIIHGKDDHLVDADLAVTSMQHFSNGKGNSGLKLNDKQKQLFHHLCMGNLLISQNFRIQNFNFDNLESNFILLLDNTGHSAHKQREDQILIPILVYLTLSHVLFMNNESPKL